MYIWLQRYFLPKAGMSRNSHSRPFPGMKASDSGSRNMGVDFFIPFPFPNCGNVLISIPFPFLNFGNGCFPFLFRSRILKMFFPHSLPVPELWEWNYPFPFLFLNSQKSFPLNPVLRRDDIVPKTDKTISISTYICPIAQCLLELNCVCKDRRYISRCFCHQSGLPAGLLDIYMIFVLISRERGTAMYYCLQAYCLAKVQPNQT